MEVEKREEEIILNLTREDIFNLQVGKTLHGGRPGVTAPDAVVDIMPLSAIDPSDPLLKNVLYATDRLERSAKTPLRAIIFSNEDLQVFVPSIKLTDVRIVNATLSKKSMETPVTENRDALLKAIPEKGIRINFVNSSIKIQLLVG